MEATYIAKHKKEEVKNVGWKQLLFNVSRDILYCSIFRLGPNKEAERCCMGTQLSFHCKFLQFYIPQTASISLRQFENFA